MYLMDHGHGKLDVYLSLSCGNLCMFIFTQMFGNLRASKYQICHLSIKFYPLTWLDIQPLARTAKGGCGVPETCKLLWACGLSSFILNIDSSGLCVWASRGFVGSRNGVQTLGFVHMCIFLGWEPGISYRIFTRPHAPPKFWSTGVRFL